MGKDGLLDVTGRCCQVGHSGPIHSTAGCSDKVHELAHLLLKVLLLHDVAVAVACSSVRVQPSSAESDSSATRSSIIEHSAGFCCRHLGVLGNMCVCHTAHGVLCRIHSRALVAVCCKPSEDMGGGLLRLFVLTDTWCWSRCYRHPVFWAHACAMGIKVQHPGGSISWSGLQSAWLCF